MPAWVLQGDLPTAAVRRMIGPDRLLGVSVKTVEQVGVGAVCRRADINLTDRFHGTVQILSLNYSIYFLSIQVSYIEYEWFPLVRMIHFC